jgi:hypothetical protein
MRFHLLRQKITVFFLACLLLQQCWFEPVRANPAPTKSKAQKTVAAMSVKANSGAAATGPLIQNILAIYQNTGPLGKAELYLSDQGGCFVARSGDVFIVTCPPSWEVMLFSRSKKQAFVLSNKEAFQNNLGLFNTPCELSKGVLSHGTDPLLHLKYTRVFVDGSKHPGKSADPFIFQERSTRVVKDLVYRVADIGKLKPELQNFLYWIYSDNNYPGLPIDSKIDYTDGSVFNLLSTESTARVAKPASIFAYPKGFKRTLNKMEVLVSNDAKATMEDLWGSVKEPR